MFLRKSGSSLPELRYKPAFIRSRFLLSSAASTSCGYEGIPCLHTRGDRSLAAEQLVSTLVPKVQAGHVYNSGKFGKTVGKNHVVENFQSQT